MKRMSVLMIALLLALSLSACSMINQYSPTPSPTASLQTQTPAPSAPSTQPTQTQDGTPLPDAQPTKAGNLAGNLSNGGLVLQGEDGVVYVALSDGIYALNNGEGTRISNDVASDMNLMDGRIYYMAQALDANGETTGVSIRSIKTDGSDPVEVSPLRNIEWDYEGTAEDDGAVAYTYYCGYNDLITYDGYVYYITDQGDAGSMTVNFKEEDETGVSQWASDKSIVRVSPDGSQATVIVPNIGSDDPHMCIVDDKIYYSTSYANCFYAYPFTRFYVCDLDGSNNQQLIDDPENQYYSSEKGSLTEQVGDLFVVDGGLYVSATDSEGDFADSRLMQVDTQAKQYAQVRKETYCVRTAASEDGNMVYFTGSELKWDEEDGVITREFVDSAQLKMARVGQEDQAVTLLEATDLSRYGDEFSFFRIAVFGDTVYVLSGSSLYEIDASTAQTSSTWKLPVKVR